MVESQIEGNVNEIPFVGAQRSREIQERVHAETREPTSGTGLGNCPGRFSRDFRVGRGSESEERSGGDGGGGGGEDENEGQKRENGKWSSPWVGSSSRVGFIEAATPHFRRGERVIRNGKGGGEDRVILRDKYFTLNSFISLFKSNIKFCR